jgi:hypothetical protein
MCEEKMGMNHRKKYSMSCFSHMALCFLIATVTLRNSMADEQSWLAAGEWTIEKHNSMGSYGVGVSPKGCGDSPDNDPLSIFVQDFEGTLSSNEWSPSTRVARAVAYFTDFLGRFGAGESAQTTFAFDTTVAQVVSFDFYRIDSWDSERFLVSFNDQFVLESPILVHNFQYSSAVEGRGGVVTWTMVPDVESYGQRGFKSNEFGNDQTFAVAMYIPANSGITSPLTIKFESTLNSNKYDESFGIDNFRRRSCVFEQCCENGDCTQQRYGHDGCGAGQYLSGCDISNIYSCNYLCAYCPNGKNKASGCSLLDGKSACDGDDATCPVAHWCPGDGTRRPCPAGTYGQGVACSAGVGTWDSTACANAGGTWTALAGVMTEEAVACVACPAGWFSVGEGNLECIDAGCKELSAAEMMAALGRNSVTGACCLKSDPGCNDT